MTPTEMYKFKLALSFHNIRESDFASRCNCTQSAVSQVLHGVIRSANIEQKIIEFINETELLVSQYSHIKTISSGTGKVILSGCAKEIYCGTKTILPEQEI
jgi:hypothetical protein